MVEKSGKIDKCDFGSQSETLESNEKCNTKSMRKVGNCNNVLYQHGSNWHYCRNPATRALGFGKCRDTVKNQRGTCSNTKPEPVSRKTTRSTLVDATGRLTQAEREAASERRADGIQHSANTIFQPLNKDFTGISNSDVQKETRIMDINKSIGDVNNAIKLNQNVIRQMKIRNTLVGPSPHPQEVMDVHDRMLKNLKFKLKKLESTKTKINKSKVSSGGKKKTKRNKRNKKTKRNKKYKKRTTKH